MVGTSREKKTRAKRGNPIRQIGGNNPLRFQKSIQFHSKNISQTQDLGTVGRIQCGRMHVGSSVC